MNDSTREPDRPSPDLRLDPVDQKTEAALAALRPSPATFDAAAAGFEAGRRAASSAARRQVTRWRIAAGVCVAGGIAAFLARGEPAVVERVQLVERERIVERVVQERVVQAPPPELAVTAESADAPPASAADSLFSLRQVALEKGVEALPRNPGGPTPTMNLRGLPW